MKLRHASAYTDNNEIDASVSYNIDNERKVESRKFIELVEGRVQEIVQNVWHQVPEELTDKLVAGIILTGGASNMKNIDEAFRNHTHIAKVRIAKNVTFKVHSSSTDVTASNGMMNTILSILAKGEINCAGPEVVPQKDIFDVNQPVPVAEDFAKPAKPAEEQPGTGKVKTATEKAKEEEERRVAEEARKQQEEEERKQQEKEAREKKPGIGNKLMNWIKNFVEDVDE